MPWNRNDYPDSMKNLDEDVRLKAIEIANAMIKDGYEEGRAIPIAISKAKEWDDDASGKEKKDLEKQKNLNDHKKDSSDSARLQDAKVKVEKRDDGKWAVMSEGAKRADSLHDTKKQAQERADEIEKNREKGEK